MQTTKAGRLALLALLSLLTTSWLGCCLCQVLPRTMIHARANRLDGWHGELELVVPAEREPGGVYLSPNGRWMLVHLGFFDHPKKWILLDLATGTEHDLRSKTDYFRWLEGDLFTHGGSILSATDLTVKDLEYREYEPELLAGAEVIYALPHFGRGGILLLSTDPNFPYAVHVRSVEGGLEGWAAAAPPGQRRVVVRGQSGGDVGPYYSPDGAFYAMEEYGPGRVEIRTQDGQVAAKAWKKDYVLNILGWAHDGSGVYFQSYVRGGFASALAPETPIFKLSVAEEQEPADSGPWDTWLVASLAAVGLALGGGLVLALVWRKRRGSGAGDA
jgi:hypothetical protein